MPGLFVSTLPDTFIFEVISPSSGSMAFTSFNGLNSSLTKIVLSVAIIVGGWFIKSVV